VIGGIAAIILVALVIGGLFRMVQLQSSPPIAGSTPAHATEKPLPDDPSYALQKATQARPFTNGLGMMFVPVPIGAGASKDKRVLFCIWETRSKDYAAFIADKARGYEMTGSDADNWRTYSSQNVPVGRGSNERAEDSTHAVQNGSWEDAIAFCAWLTTTERTAGYIGGRDIYRLPTDVEWSYAVGIGDQEDAGATPEAKDMKITDVYPWGTGFPPPGGSGNYGDDTAKAILGFTGIDGYRDGYATTSPVGTFTPNKLGLCDLGGNVWEWCQDYYFAVPGSHVMRGGSWFYGNRDFLLSSRRRNLPPDNRNISCGFRCVLGVGSGLPKSH
jgi:formylglycine-generating enzyme required for sulfatase activity